jgi:hypothetical protein
MRYAEHVARMGEMRIAHWILVGKHEEKRYSEVLRFDGKIILKGILGK